MKKLMLAGLLLGGCASSLSRLAERMTPGPWLAAGEPLVPTAIVLHSTSGKSFDEAVALMKEGGTSVHVLIRADGRAHQLVPFDRRARGARGMNDAALHVSVESVDRVSETAEVVRLLAAAYGIPMTNFDVASRRGIFSHGQCKARFGGLCRGEKKDLMEPGEDFVRSVLERLGATYTPEARWKDRTGDGWPMVMEVGDAGRKREYPDKGRGLGFTPFADLKSVVHTVDNKVQENMRIKYFERGKIKPTGVVLHFTATKDYLGARNTMEDRKLWPTLMADTDGAVHQVLDTLEDKPAAAAGTNDSCIQIEIVGRDEGDLLENKAQLKGVVKVVAELCFKYDIPKTNADIVSLKGVFSHGQAKKRFGRSAWMWGEDFDPGETYMKKVIEGIGGTYVPEAQWKDRLSDNWVVFYPSWLP